MLEWLKAMPGKQGTSVATRTPQALVNRGNLWAPCQTCTAESPGFGGRNLQICIFNKLTNWVPCTLKLENLYQEERGNVSVRDSRKTDGPATLDDARRFPRRGTEYSKQGTPQRQHGSSGALSTPRPTGVRRCKRRGESCVQGPARQKQCPLAEEYSQNQAEGARCQSFGKHISCLHSSSSPRSPTEPLHCLEPTGSQRTQEPGGHGHGKSPPRAEVRDRNGWKWACRAGRRGYRARRGREGLAVRTGCLHKCQQHFRSENARRTPTTGIMTAVFTELSLGFAL